MKNTLIANHHTYRKGPTLKGNIACVKRLYERVEVKIMLPKDKIMNLFKPEMGSEVPLQETVVQGIETYVVVPILDQSKQSARGTRVSGEGPKGNSLQKNVEFGISRHAKALGRRRIHSTIKVSGKGFSNSKVKEPWFEGQSFSYLIYNLNQSLCMKGYAENLTEVMSDPNFLIGCWAKIKSKPGNMTPGLDGITLDGISKKWFETVSQEFRSGKFHFKPNKRVYTNKANGKKRPLTIPSPRDKIIQEGMRILLELIFEKEFFDSSHAFRPGRGCHTCLKSIRFRFSKCNWFIEGGIEQQYPTINQNILVKILRTKIKDEPFIDLVYKYLRVGYGETPQRIRSVKKGLLQGGVLSPILSNIYMNEFDRWVEEQLIPKYTKRRRKKANPKYTKMIRQGKALDKSIRTTIGKDEKYSKVYYVRYVDDFLIGVNGSKAQCIEIRNAIKEYLNLNLKLELNIQKTNIIHTTTDHADFLGHHIKCTPMQKHPVAYNKKGKLVRKTTNTQLLAPIRIIVSKLNDKGFAKNGRPTRNGRYINYDLWNIIQSYKNVERGILNYYSMSNNYGRLAARIHYILKYSCALTIASKMKLKTLKKTFGKYGKNLTITDGNGSISYPTIEYKRPKVQLLIEKEFNLDRFIEQLVKRYSRHRGNIVGPCIVCGAKDDIEVHHIRALKNIRDKNDWLAKTMALYSRKQVPVCKFCHSKIHKGEHDRKKIR